MTKIRILIYTDYKHINENPELYSWGITELKKFLLDKTAKLAEFEVHYQYRFASKEPQRLTADFLARYHQVWVLAFATSLSPLFILSDEEVEALHNWTNKPNGFGGGLLVAGDHAAGTNVNENPAMLSAHGRSLGERMKRAGELRVWQGPPTALVRSPLRDSDNFNTCQGNDPTTLDRMEAQTDKLSARLLELPTAHSLFFWKIDQQGNIQMINRFPDHQHESKLQIPGSLSADWPSLSPPPVLAAQVRDQRFPNEQRLYPIIVAYDGDLVDVGRIVVDSSFHHYLNINLFGLPKRSDTGYPEPDSDLDQIAQFYGNLAFWLTPRAIRQHIKSDLFLRLATDPDVFEVRGTGPENLGRVGRFALSLRIGADNLHRIVSFTEHDSSANFLHKALAGIFLESQTKLSDYEGLILLGSIIEAYHDYILEKDFPDLDWLDVKPNPQVMISKGVASANQIIPNLSQRL